MTRSLTLLLAFPLAAAAADLKPFQVEAKEAFDEQMKNIVAELNTACGTKFTDVKSDFEAFDKANFRQMPPGQTCSQLTYAVKETCKSPAYQKALQSKVKGLACLTAPAAADAKDTFTMVDGVFTYRMTLKGGGLDATKALKAELDR